MTRPVYSMTRPVYMEPPSSDLSEKLPAKGGQYAEPSSMEMFPAQDGQFTELSSMELPVGPVDGGNLAKPLAARW
jgi:hypothetical protein